MKRLSRYFFFFVAFSFLLGNPLYSQEKTTASESEDVGGGTRVYRYLTDDLGYFDKLHGTQRYYRQKSPGQFNFNLECDNEKPISYSFQASKFPLSAANLNLLGSLTSRGLYDQDGICTLSSRYSTPFDPGTGMIRAMSAYRLGSKIGFMAKLTTCARDNSMEKQIQYGWIEKNNQCVISYTENSPQPNYKPNTSNSILYNHILYLFQDKETMTEFSQFVSNCRNAEEIKSSQYYLSTVTKSYLTEAPWAPGFTRWDCYSGFTNCKKHDSFSSCYFFIPSIGWGEDDELHYSGLNYDVIKNASQIYEIQKKTWAVEEKKPLSFLTKEQYEKYKDRIEYHVREHRHGVKKADGSYLYVPEEIEAGIVKTDTEKQQDIKEENRRQRELLPYETVYDACKAANNLPGDLEVNMEYVLNSLFEDAFVVGAEEFERNYDLVKKKFASAEKERQAKEEAIKEEMIKAINAKDFDTVDNLSEKVSEQGKPSLLEAAVIATIDSNNDSYTQKYIQKLVECQANDYPALKNAFIKAVSVQDYSKASIYRKYLKQVKVGDDWFVRQIDAGKNTNAVIFNVKYSQDKKLEYLTYSAISTGVANDRLLKDDYSYILKTAEYFNNETLNVMSAFLAAKEGNLELAEKYISKVNNFNSFNYFNRNNEWSIHWGQLELCSSKSCPIANKKCSPEILLLCCALLDKSGHSIESFNLCKSYAAQNQDFDKYWTHFSTSPGIVMWALLEQKPEVMTDHALWVALLESLDPAKDKEFMELMDECRKCFKGRENDPHLRTIYWMELYSQGFLYMRRGLYEKAIDFFKSCNHFQDYKERIKECKAKMKEQ